MIGAPVTVGRLADVPLGAHLVDEGISRVAMTVTAGTGGWTIEIGNRNGAALRPWGPAPQRALATQVVRWPLVAVRIAGTRSDQQHWVLLENDAYGGDTEPPDSGPGETRLGTLPPPLAPAERAALQMAFREFLACHRRRPRRRRSSSSRWRPGWARACPVCRTGWAARWTRRCDSACRRPRP